MTDMINPDGKAQTDKFQRFIALSGGEFWRAKRDIEDRYVSVDEVLMINQVDYVDNKAHTVHVRIHPSKTSSFRTVVKFLFDEFVENFEFVEKAEAEQVRQDELAAIQGRIKDEQDEMQQAYTNPDLLDKLADRDMPREDVEGKTNLPVKLETFDADIVGAIKTQNLTALMSKGLTIQGVEQIKSGLDDQRKIAVRRSEWIQMRTKRLTQMSAEMTPFFEEHAALALAMTKDMRDHVDDLMKGIANLNLYVLKDVEIEQLRKGVSAPRDIKLSVAQRVLYMDEELAVWDEVDDGFDCQDRDRFFKMMGESDGLINQIFPTDRSIVSMATTRKYHAYEGYTAQAAHNMHKENQRQFLLVRDGTNVYAVLSTEYFHNFAKTLFPTTDATEAPFRGFDGRNISYQDLEYTRSLEQHERIALGYKRLLILLCGLDHNKQLFGEFYEGESSLEFVSMGFQEKYFNFIHDVDGQGLLPSYRPDNVAKWAKKMNEELSFGSRIIMQWRYVMDENNIPAAFEKENQWNSRSDNSRSMQYTPTVRGDTLTGVVSRKGKSMVMQVEVSGETINYKQRTFNAMMDISRAVANANTFDILCVDRLNPKDANWYLHDRPSRTLNVSGIRMLKRAIKMAEEYRTEEVELRASLEDAMTASAVFDDMEVVERLIDHAIAKWRCANPSKDVQEIVGDQKTFNTLCDQIFFLGGKGRDPKEEIMASEQALGRTVIRLSLLANGKYAAYSTPLESERDDRVMAFSWVAKTTYSLLKSSVKPAKVTFVHLGEINNAETIVFELEDIAAYLEPKNNAFSRPVDKAKMFEGVKAGFPLYQQIVKMKADNDKEAIYKMIESFDENRDHLTYHSSKSKSKGVVAPIFALPIGVTVKDREAYYIGATDDVSSLLAWLVAGDQVMENELVEVYSSIYADKHSAAKRMRNVFDRVKGKTLFEALSIKLYQSKKAGFLSGSGSLSYYHIHPSDGYKYSIAKRFDELEVNGITAYFEGSTLETLDADLGIVKPDNWEPLIVRTNGGFTTDKVLDVFAFTPELRNVLRGQISIYDSMDALEKSHKTSRYGTMGEDKDHYEVTLEWKEVPARTVREVKAMKSYVYEEVSRVKKPSMFD